MVAEYEERREGETASCRLVIGYRKEPNHTVLQAPAYAYAYACAALL